jgi:hypothetical protein
MIGEGQSKTEDISETRFISGNSATSFSGGSEALIYKLRLRSTAWRLHLVVFFLESESILNFLFEY